MSVNYSLVKYENKMGKNAGESKFYARAQVHESITLKMFSKLISMQTTVSRADVSAVLVSAVENLVMELQRGNKVEFDKNEVPPWFAVPMGSVAESVGAKLLFLH